jgi:hypothetical protein
MYRRSYRGVVERGKTRDFLEAMRESKVHQEDRGIRARTSVWAGMTGPTNTVVIVSDFNTLDDLERFSDLVTEDARFAVIRRAVRSQMVYEGSDVVIQRLSYHSEGLISSEDATAPRRYMRVSGGQHLPGRQREFIVAISEALEYQKKRGIDATTSVWSHLTGRTSGIDIVGEFDSLAELERFEDMAMRDTEFSALRKATRENMVFLTGHVDLLRNML